MKRVLVPLADGCEELEAITIIDLLRRAEIEVVVAGLNDGPVTASRGVVIMPDKTLDEVLGMEFDMVVLPGGMPGSKNLDNDQRVHAVLKKLDESGGYTAAICAAPMVLAHAGILNGKKATSYPGVLDNMNLPEITFTGRPVERDGNVVTSRGPGTAMDFALELIEVLKGSEDRQKVEQALVRP